MIGVDITVISRMEKMYDKFGNKAYKKFLNDDEIALIKKPVNAAGFWAAKEAASKALGTGIGKDCSFHDIMIGKSDKGAPLISFSDKINNNFKIENSSISISHDGGFAIAVVAIETKKD